MLDASTASAFKTRPPIDTVVTAALRAPVVKILRLRLPLVGSNGPSWSVSALRIKPSPMPSPVFVKMPGAARNVGTLPREGKFSELVTMTSAVPISVWAGTRKLIWAGETKKICAARPLTVTRVPLTLVGNNPSPRRCDCAVLLARFVPCAAAMLFGATALIADVSWPKDASLRIAVSAPFAGRAGGAMA